MRYYPLLLAGKKIKVISLNMKYLTIYFYKLESRTKIIKWNIILTNMQFRFQNNVLPLYNIERIYQTQENLTGHIKK